MGNTNVNPMITWRGHFTLGSCKKEVVSFAFPPYWWWRNSPWKSGGSYDNNINITIGELKRGRRGWGKLFKIEITGASVFLDSIETRIAVDGGRRLLFCPDSQSAPLPHLLALRLSHCIFPSSLSHVYPIQLKARNSHGVSQLVFQYCLEGGGWL